jgi:hypothetical protein
MVNQNKLRHYLQTILKNHPDSRGAFFAKETLAKNWDEISSRNLRRLWREVSWRVAKAKRQAIKKEDKIKKKILAEETEKKKQAECALWALEAKLAEEAKRVDDLSAHKKGLDGLAAQKKGLADLALEPKLAAMKEDARLAQLLSLKKKIMSLSGGSKNPPVLKLGISYTDWVDSFNEFDRCIKEYKKLAGIPPHGELDF